MKNLHLSPIIKLALRAKEFAQINLSVDDIVDLGILQVPPRDAENAIEKSPFFFKINGVPISLLAAEIKKIAITMLHTEACQLVCEDCEEEPLRGLRICYGVNSSNTLTLYYQPLVFCPTEPVKEGPGGKGYCCHQLCTEGDFYTYTPGAVKFDKVIDIATMNAELAKYRQPNVGIGIRRDVSSVTFENFITATDIRGDVKSLVFSFDQLLNVCDYPGNNGYIRFWNTAGLIPTNNYGSLIKHLLLLSSDDVTNNGNDLIVSALSFSDLSHICPPSCNGNKFLFIVLL